MTTQERIARLESLLARVRRNAQTRPTGPAREEVRAAVEVAPMAHQAPPVPPAAKAAPPPPITGPRMPSPPVAAQPSLPIGTAPSPVRPPQESVPSLEVQSVSDDQIEELDMLEEEEIFELGEPAAAAASPVSPDIDFEDEEEAAPASAPRPAASLEAALEEVPEVYEAEPPIKTPPPESGRQPLTAPPAAPREGELAGAADIDALLEADVSSAPVSKVSAASETVEDLEIEEVMVASPPAPAAVAAAPAPLRPEVTARPVPPAEQPAAFVAPPPAPRLETFVALLDASLRLGE